MTFRISAAIAVILALSGCAIHPMPEDVAGVGTSDIVRQIRCETREALRQQVIAWLDDLGTDHPSQSADPIARRLADRYKSQPETFSEFSSKLFPGPEYIQVRNSIDTFADAAVAYNFDLTMIEDNNLSTEINLLKPLTRPTFNLGIGAGANRRRANERIFTISDTFGFLVSKLNRAGYCDNKLVQANFVYPIAGRIGVDRLVYDFVNLSLFGNLAGAGAPTMADKLTFTTTVSLSATPSLEFSPIGSNLQLANASVTGLAGRSDIHQVTVALAIAKKGMTSLASLRSYLFSTERARVTATAGAGPRGTLGGSVVVGARVTGGGTASEVLAVLTIDQLKSRELQIVTAP